MNLKRRQSEQMKNTRITWTHNTFNVVWVATKSARLVRTARRQLARWGRKLSMTALKSLRQADEDARDPGVEIGCGFLDVYAQREGEAFVGFRLAVAGT